MRSAFALRIISGIGFLFGIQKSLRAFLNPHFTSGVVTVNCICNSDCHFNHCSPPRENGIAERIPNRSYRTKNRAARRLPGFVIQLVLP